MHHGSWDSECGANKMEVQMVVTLARRAKTIQAEVSGRRDAARASRGKGYAPPQRKSKGEICLPISSAKRRPEGPKQSSPGQAGTNGHRVAPGYKKSSNYQEPRRGETTQLSTPSVGRWFDQTYYPWSDMTHRFPTARSAGSLGRAAPYRAAHWSACLPQ